MKKTYAILNLVVLLGVVFWNYLSNTGIVSENTVGSLSDDYLNLFTPAGYAFSIWGLIFLWLLALCVYMLRSAFSSEGESDWIERLGPFLLVANVGNAAWLWFWLTEQTGISVLVMLVILVSLLAAVVRLGIGRNAVSGGIRNWVWRPVGLYAGWISVATVANVSAYLAKIGWEGGLSEVTWTLVMIGVAGLLNVAVVLKRRMYVFGAVGIWALVAIAVRHWGEFPALQWGAVVSAGVIAASIGVGVLGKR